MPGTLKSQSRLAKSNRIQGDLFELLTLKHLVTDIKALRLGDLSFDHGQTLKDLSAELSLTPVGSSRLTSQIARAESVRPALRTLITQRTTQLGPVANLIWSGRTKDPSTTADIKIIHTTGATTELTLKSAASGTGTLRNLGLTGRLLKRFTPASLAPDFSALAPLMFAYAKEAIASVSGPARLREVTTSRRIRRDLLTDQERLACASVGRDVSDLAADLFIELFESLEPHQIREFVKELLGRPASNVFSVVANDQATFVGPLKSVTGPVTISRNSDPAIRGLWLKVRDTPVLRLEFNCTNGLGISPLCVRSFSA